jgi:hypothetical protein
MGTPPQACTVRKRRATINTATRPNAMAIKPSVSPAPVCDNSFAGLVGVGVVEDVPLEPEVVVALAPGVPPANADLVD